MMQTTGRLRGLRLLAGAVAVGVTGCAGSGSVATHGVAGPGAEPGTTLAATVPAAGAEAAAAVAATPGTTATAGQTGAASAPRRGSPKPVAMVGGTRTKANNSVGIRFFMAANSR